MTHARKKSIRQPSPPKAASGADGSNHRWQAASLCLVLAAITFAVFGQTLHHEFVNYDDGLYVFDNPVVARGLTLKGTVWALTHVETDYWHPLTWLTNMADCQVYGLWAGGHHLTSVALHTVAAMLLFLALKEMTGSLWRSAFVAAIFAIHPLRVESVAWIAERKDVLSGVFFMLTLWTYARYARQPSRGRGVAVAVAYGFGLSSKNTVVTLPFVLLLLDWWPLHRVTLDGAGDGKGGVARLVALFGAVVKEKIPLFLLSVGACVATVLAPEKVVGSERLPFLERIGNAVVSYVIYLRQMVFPAGLAIPYLNPPNGLPFWKVALAFILLVAISTSVLACRKKHPYLLVGWLWYLGMLVPSIGFVQIAYHAHADRYTYLPGIGLVLAGTWTVGDWSEGWKHRQAVLGGLMAAVVGALMVCAWIQTGYWKNDEILWTHTLSCTTNNEVANLNLGGALFKKGRVDEAMSHYQKALQIKPDYAEAYYDIGNVLLQKGRTDEAITQFQQALQIKPDDAETHLNLGICLDQKGRVGEAIAHYQKALEIKPGYPDAHLNLGNALVQKGKVDEAISHFQKALQIKPDYAEAHYNLGIALFKKGRVDEAISHYQVALQIKPDYAEAHLNLGICLDQSGRVGEAIPHFQQALAINPNYAEAHLNLGTALCQEGKADEAISHFEQALHIKPLYAEAHYNLGLALVQNGRADEAITHYQKALEIKPDYAEAHNNLGNALLQKGKVSEAITHFQKGLQINPANPGVLNNLAWVFATSAEASLRNGDKAVDLARQANALTGGENPIILHTLAAALAEAGRFSEAVETAQHALRLAAAQSNARLTGALQSEIKLYQTGRPFHGPAQPH